MKNFNPEFVKKIYDLWENEFHMKPIKINNTDCYECRGEYLRLDTFPADDGVLLYCIEWAINLEDANMNFFEDAWLYAEDMGIDEIISEMRRDISSDLPAL